MEPTSARILRTIALQYNPDTVTRSLQPQMAAGEAGDRLESLRLKGPPQETIRVEAEFDATEQLEQPDLNSPNQVVAKVGLHAQLAALELLVYPTSTRLLANERQSQRGTIEITPVEAPLTLFVWNRRRSVPVRLTDFSITEEAFDTSLNPIRAKVSLGMRVLTVDDLGFAHRGGGIYMAHLQNKEALASMSGAGELSQLGLTKVAGA